MDEFATPQYEDVFTITCSDYVSMPEIIFNFFNNTPIMVKILMWIRNFLVSLIGLKSDYALIGADDTHLSFRIILSLNNNILSCKTQVIFNNNFGRFYFFVVKPFHKLIVPSRLKASIKNLVVSALNKQF